MQRACIEWAMQRVCIEWAMQLCNVRVPLACTGGGEVIGLRPRVCGIAEAVYRYDPVHAHVSICYAYRRVVSERLHMCIDKTRSMPMSLYAMPTGVWARRAPSRSAASAARRESRRRLRQPATT